MDNLEKGKQIDAFSEEKAKTQVFMKVRKWRRSSQEIRRSLLHVSQEVSGIGGKLLIKVAAEDEVENRID